MLDEDGYVDLLYFVGTRTTQRQGYTGTLILGTTREN
jgi:hypothetical protein